MSFSKITITQDYTLADGGDPSGTVTFTPTVPMSNGGVIVPAAPVTARLDGLGNISIDLDANTDPGTLPAGVYYKVVELINGIPRSFNIQIPHDQGGSLILYTLAQLATPPAVSFPNTMPSSIVHAVGNSGSALTLDPTVVGPVKTITLTANCTFTLTGATTGYAIALELILTQDGTGSRTVTWPGSVKWSTGAPTLSTAAGAVDRLVLVSYDGGSTWYGDLIGKGYA